MENADFASILLVDLGEDGYTFSGAVYDANTDQTGVYASDLKFCVEGESLEKAKEEYEKSHRGTLQLGHCKVLMISERLFEDSERLVKVLDDLREDGELQKSVKMCVVDASDGVMDASVGVVDESDGVMGASGGTADASDLLVVLNGVLKRKKDPLTFMDCYVRMSECKKVEAVLFSVVGDEIHEEGIVIR